MWWLCNTRQQQGIVNDCTCTQSSSQQQTLPTMQCSAKSETLGLCSPTIWFWIKASDSLLVRASPSLIPKMKRLVTKSKHLTHSHSYPPPPHTPSYYTHPPSSTTPTLLHHTHPPSTYTHINPLSHTYSLLLLPSALETSGLLTPLDLRPWSSSLADKPCTRSIQTQKPYKGHNKQVVNSCQKLRKQKCHHLDA